jgi:hypothetical protein
MHSQYLIKTSPSKPAVSPRRIKHTRRGAPRRWCTKRKSHAGSTLPKQCRRSASESQLPGFPARTACTVARAWCAPPPGRPPNEHGRKSCSESAARTAATRRGRTRAPRHGPPSGRSSRGPGCGMSGRRPGGGRSPCVGNARRVVALQAATSCVRSSTVWPSLPGAVGRGTCQSWCHTRSPARCGARLVQGRVGACRAFAALLASPGDMPGGSSLCREARYRPVHGAPGALARCIVCGPLPPVMGSPHRRV